MNFRNVTPKISQCHESAQSCVIFAASKKQRYDRKTMTCHESLHSLASGEDVNFVLLPRFLIVECELLSPL